MRWCGPRLEGLLEWSLGTAGPKLWVPGQCPLAKVSTEPGPAQEDVPHILQAPKCHLFVAWTLTLTNPW